MTRAAVPRVPLFSFKYILESSVIFPSRSTGTRNRFFFYVYLLESIYVVDSDVICETAKFQKKKIVIHHLVCVKHLVSVFIRYSELGHSIERLKQRLKL